MGSSRNRRKNVTPLAGGGSVVAVSGEIILNCRFSGSIAATTINGAVGGQGYVRRAGGDIVLTSGQNDIARLDPHDPLFDRLAHCLDRDVEYHGVLTTDNGGPTVNVRPRS